MKTGVRNEEEAETVEGNSPAAKARRQAEEMEVYDGEEDGFVRREEQMRENIRIASDRWERERNEREHYIAICCVP